MIQDEALVCHRHQASCLGGQDDRSILQELQENNDNKNYFDTTKNSFHLSVKVTGFASTAIHNELNKLAPLFHLIRSKIKTNCDSLALVFLHFASAICSCIYICTYQLFDF